MRSASARSVCSQVNAVFGASEMSERRGLLVNRAPQIKVLDDALRRQLEVRPHQLGDLAESAILPVPYVSTMTDTGSATPMA